MIIFSPILFGNISLQIVNIISELLAYLIIISFIKFFNISIFDTYLENLRRAPLLKVGIGLKICLNKIIIHYLSEYQLLDKEFLIFIFKLFTSKFFMFNVEIFGSVIIELFKSF